MWLESDYINRIRIGGIIMLHDIAWEGVARATDEFLKHHRTEYTYIPLFFNSAGLGVITRIK